LLFNILIFALSIVIASIQITNLFFRFATDTPAKLYNNKSICVTGTIKEYKGKAEIIVSKQEQIKVLSIKFQSLKTFTN